jgi:hypothetical protein
MNIIFGADQIPNLDEKYVILELDTFRLPGRTEPATAYCVVENVGFANLHRVPEFKDLHHNLIANYRQRNWKYCEDAMQFLRGFWGGEMDTFYDELQNRIDRYKVSDPGETWDGIIDKN